MGIWEYWIPDQVRNDKKRVGNDKKSVLPDTDGWGGLINGIKK
jgi:hypothetical protein